MPLLMGLYIAGRDVYGEDVIPMFDALIDRWKLGARAATVLLEGDRDNYRFLTYNFVKRACAMKKYRKLVCLYVIDKSNASDFDHQSPVFDFKHTLHEFDGVEIGIYRGAWRKTFDEVSEILSLLPDNFDLRYGFATEVSPYALSTNTVGAIGSGDLRGSAPGIRKGLHLKDQMRDVCDFNILSAEHLARPVGDKTLRQWIVEEGHGTLTPFRDCWIWEPPRLKIATIRGALEEAGVLLPLHDDEDENAVQDRTAEIIRATDDSSPSRVDTSKRDALVARMNSAAPRQATVSLEDFFAGNEDPASFWPNISEPVALSDARARLLKIRARDDVRDVRIILTQFDGGENEWPFSDAVLFVTSRDKKALRGWLGRNCAPDDISIEQYPPDDLYPAPESPAGMRVFLAWWD